MQNVVFLRDTAVPLLNPELKLNATLFACGAELVQLSGLITMQTPDNVKKLRVADVANEIAQLNRAITDYLEACPHLHPEVQ